MKAYTLPFQKLLQYVKLLHLLPLWELQSFIGLVNYYSRFQPHLAHHMSPVHKLLRKEAHWKWTNAEQQVFEKVKSLISEQATLAHYNENAVLTCDASPVGIGAVIETSVKGVRRPIAFISRSLTKAEQHYVQIEREALAIVFALQKFRHYLLKRTFTLRTDHKPLTLFGEQWYTTAHFFKDQAMGPNTVCIFLNSATMKITDHISSRETS